MVGRVPSEAGDEQAPLDPHKSTDYFEQAPSSGGLVVDGSCGKGNLDRRPSTTNMTGDKEKEKDKKKSMRPDQEPFEAWEREEMEKLLGELRGHLGEILSISELPLCGRLSDGSISHISDAILGRRGHCKQFPVQRRQAHAAPDLQLIFIFSHPSIIISFDYRPSPHRQLAVRAVPSPTRIPPSNPPTLIILQRTLYSPFTRTLCESA